MNIPPTPSAAIISLAGVSRAAAQGGEQESRASEAVRQQRNSEAPLAKLEGVESIDAGEAAGDGGADGRQTYDQFDKQEPTDHDSDSKTMISAEKITESSVSSVPENTKLADHIDFEA